MLVFDPVTETPDARLADAHVPAAHPPAGAIASRRVIEAAKRGDRAALAALLQELQDPWYRLCLSMLRDADLAAEAVQETGLRFLKQVGGFRGDSQLRTWSFGIAINVVREAKRRRGRHPTGNLTDDGADGGSGLADRLNDSATLPQAASELGEARDALRHSLADLPDRQREAIVLRFFEDLSIEETAQAMGCATGTVKATVHQALRSLRRRLKPWA